MAGARADAGPDVDADASVDVGGDAVGALSLISKPLQCLHRLSQEKRKPSAACEHALAQRNSATGHEE
jgi:hypothetical protein